MKICALLVNILLILNVISYCDGFIDPFSIGSAAIGIGSALFSSIYCKHYECCTAQYIPADINALKKFLDDNLFGQHIVRDQIVTSLNVHYNTKVSNKPLVMSFHGTPGTGKNYVADAITNSFYKLGSESQYVHKFTGKIHFPLEEKVDEYKVKLTHLIESIVSKCPQSLFIFDEVDKMPVGIFDSLTALLDQHPSVNGVDYRKSTFIFLSNTGGVEIGDTLLSKLKAGLLREETQLFHFEKIIETCAYNKDGGFSKSATLEASVIDHFVPFLPLEKHHVIECIRKEFWSRGNSGITVEKINNILEYVTYDSESGLFATSGCKKISKKVDLFL